MAENFLEIFENTLFEMTCVYKNDERPWLLGYSGGKDSSLLVWLVIEMILRLPKNERTKKIFIVTSDTGVENPIIKKYMHSSSKKINEFSKANFLNIKSEIIFPDCQHSFWPLVIGLGYPTPEPPGFRWCTEKLKILPMNRYTNSIIKKYGKVILLLGVRKAESTARMRSISQREIEGKILYPHTDIQNAYVYSPLSEIPNELVWKFLLHKNGISPWGADMKYLFSLYQGEDFFEEQSALGQVDKTKIASAGNSRFGCWCCTIVKTDKSLERFIQNGHDELKPLKEFRSWLCQIRNCENFREKKRRNGSVYKKANGELGLGPFSMEGRKKILQRLLELQRDTGFELISLEELKTIDSMWDNEGDLCGRNLLEIYFSVFKKHLPWDEYKKEIFDCETICQIKNAAQNANVPFELVCKLLSMINAKKNLETSAKISREFDSILRQEWIYHDAVEMEMKNEN